MQRPALILTALLASTGCARDDFRVVTCVSLDELYTDDQAALGSARLVIDSPDVDPGRVWLHELYLVTDTGDGWRVDWISDTFPVEPGIGVSEVLFELLVEDDVFERQLHLRGQVYIEARDVPGHGRGFMTTNPLSSCPVR